MTQPLLFPDPTAPAKDVPPLALPTLREGHGRIIELLARYPEGLTAQDLKWATSSSDASIRRRLGELQARGLVADSGPVEADWRGEWGPVWVLQTAGNYTEECQW